MAIVVTLPLASEIQRALDRLKSLHDGDLGVVEITVAAVGPFQPSGHSCWKAKPAGFIILVAAPPRRSRR